MAFTQSTIMDGVVFGNQRIRIQRVTCDSAEANLDSGLKVLNGCFIQPEKGQTMPAAQVNKDSTATASNGIMGVSGASSGNIFQAIFLGV